MTDDRPSAEVLRQLAIEDLGRTFVLHAVDSAGFAVASDGPVVRVNVSAAGFDSYLSRIEESAHDAIGLDPPWRSALSLAVVHIGEEAAMAEAGMAVIIDGDVIRRDPPPGLEPAVGDDAGGSWSAVTPVSGATIEFGSDHREAR